MSLDQQIAELVAKLVREELEKARPHDDGALLSLERAAERLDVSVSYLRKRIRAGKLPAFNVGSCVRLRVADVDALAVSARRPTQDRKALILAAARGKRGER